MPPSVLGVGHPLSTGIAAIDYAVIAMSMLPPFSSTITAEYYHINEEANRTALLPLTLHRNAPPVCSMTTTAQSLRLRMLSSSSSRSSLLMESAADSSVEYREQLVLMDSLGNCDITLNQYNEYSTDEQCALHVYVFLHFIRIFSSRSIYI